MDDLTIRLLGVPTVSVNGQAFVADTRKALALLAYLSVTGHPQSRDTLAAILWPDYDEESARSSLRRTLSSLRKALQGRWVATQRDAISLGSDGVWLDVVQFRALLASWRSHAHPSLESCEQCHNLLKSAEELYQGGFMRGFSLRDSPEFDDWQAQQAAELDAELDRVLANLVNVQEARGELRAAMSSAKRRLDLDALNEEAHFSLMRLLALAGERSAALRQYRECVRVLDQELGVQPLESTTDLYRAISEGQVTTLSRGIPSTTISTGHQGDTAVPGAVLRSMLPFVGRRTELESLPQLLNTAKTAGHLVVLEGEAGIGKTRLLSELTNTARAQGSRVVSARCFEGEASLAYEAFVALLRGSLELPDVEERLSQTAPASVAEAARLVPEIATRFSGPLPPQNPATPGAQARFFTGVLEVLATILAGDSAGIIAIDDVGWADDASQELLRFLCRRRETWPLLVIVTWRPENVPPGHALHATLANARKDDSATLIRLSRFSREDVQELVESALSEPVHPEITSRLFDETEGLPLFLAQYLASDLEALSASSAEWPVPPGIQDVLRERVSHLSATSGQLLTAAAVLGRAFTFELLHEVSGRSEEEALSGLDELVRNHLIEEAGSGIGASSGNYDFSHEKLRSLVYEDAGFARRRLLHRRAAQALIQDRRLRLEGGALAGMIANHLRMAGDEAEAARYFVQAGDYARGLHANSEAKANYELALALGRDEPAALYEALGDLHTLAGDYGSAVVAFETAAAMTNEERLPILEHKLGSVYQRSGEWEMAQRHLESALNGFAANDEREAQALVLVDLSLTAYRRNDLGPAKELAQRALAMVESEGEEKATSQAHNVLGVLSRRAQESEAAGEHFRQSLQLSEQQNDIAGRIASLNNLALLHLDQENLDSAQATAEAALNICVTFGDRHREAAIRNNLADIHHRAGHPDEAMAQLKLAVAIFSEVGLSPDVVEPEIWKLVEW